ncbi:hypothetical protein RJT34_05672 [Clitoria ternatea]|uniref:Uncharacterized protein n=1 Tax=Clitoria ternatea TaxID=43366 RepID=A0AAN9K3Y4_CLITE
MHLVSSTPIHILYSQCRFLLDQSSTQFHVVERLDFYLRGYLYVYFLNQFSIINCSFAGVPVFLAAI